MSSLAENHSLPLLRFLACYISEFSPSSFDEIFHKLKSDGVYRHKALLQCCHVIGQHFYHRTLNYFKSVQISLFRMDDYFVIFELSLNFKHGLTMDLVG